MLIVAVLFLGIVPPLPAYAAATETVYLETLIDEDNKTYMTNVIADNFNANKKYEFKYTQINGFMESLCGAYDGTNSDNPNYCYSLSDKVKYTALTSDASGNSTGFNGLSWIAGYSQNTTFMEFFAKSEGFFDDSLNTVTKTEDATKLLGGDLVSAFYQDGSKRNTNAIFEYPAKLNGNDVTPKESDYAVQAGNTLTASLNQILSVVNGGRKYSSIAELVNKSILIRPMKRDSNIAFLSAIQGKQKGYVIFYAPDDASEVGKYSPSNSATLVEQLDSTVTSSTAFWHKMPKVNADGNLLAYIFEVYEGKGVANGEDITFSFADNSNNLDNIRENFVLNPKTMIAIPYAIPKGYKATAAGTVIFPDASGKQQGWANSDIPYLTIHMLAQNANNAYKQYGLTISTVNHSTDSGIAYNFIQKIFAGLINGISSILQLTTTNDLIYNGGIRGSSLHNWGTMSDNWWNVVMRYHLIFQALAWFVIIVGFLKTLISLNLSTINPAVRESVYNAIQKFIVTGFALVLIIPVTQFLMELNSSVVQIFASQVDTGLRGAPPVDGLAGIVVSLCYLGINIYINFVYIMRSITLALLIVSGPFFIATISISRAGQSKMFTAWAKELVCNIFIQSVHAFTMAFLVNLMQSGTGLESLVISFSIIPITEMFRALILQGGAGTTEGLAKSAAAQATAAGSAMIGAAANGAAALGGKLLGAKEAESSPDGEAGGKGKAGGGQQDGFGALNSGVNAKLSKLREDGIKRGGVLGGVERAGAFAGKVTKGGIKGAAGIASMATNMAMGQFTGQAGYFGKAGETAGGMATSAMAAGVAAAGEVSDSVHDYHQAQHDRDNAIAETKAILGGSGALGGENYGRNIATAGAIADIAKNGSRRQKELASDMQTVLKGSSAEGYGAAKARLASAGITGLSQDSSGGVSYNLGYSSGFGQASAIKKLANGQHVHSYDFGGTSTTVKEGGSTSAVTTLTSQQVQEKFNSDYNFRDTFGQQASDGSWHLKSSFADMPGGGRLSATQTADGGLQIKMRDAEASKDGKRIISAAGTGMDNLINPALTSYSPLGGKEGGTGSYTMSGMSTLEPTKDTSGDAQGIQ